MDDLSNEDFDEDMRDYSSKVKEEKLGQRKRWMHNAKQMLDDLELKLRYTGGSQNVPSIFMNQTQAKTLNWGLKHSKETHEAYIFMVTNRS